MSTRDRLRAVIRRAGFNIERAGTGYTERRQQIFASYGVDLAVDVGANTGQWVGRVRAAGYRGRIVSFEPLGEPFRTLERAAERDPKWKAVRVAVSDSESTVELHVSDNTIFSSVLPLTDLGEGAAPRAFTVGSESVPARRLDDLIANDPASRLALKIDVQGYERAVLDGAAQTLDRTQVIEMELTPTAVYEDQMLMPEALDRLSQHGFVLSLVGNLLPERSTGRALQFDGVFCKAT